MPEVLVSKTNRMLKQARLCNNRLPIGKVAANRIIAAYQIQKFVVFHKTKEVERVSIISWSMRSQVVAVNSSVTIHETTVVYSIPIIIRSKVYSCNPLTSFNMVVSKSERHVLSRTRPMVKARFSIVRALNQPRFKPEPKPRSALVLRNRRGRATLRQFKNIRVSLVSQTQNHHQASISHYPQARTIASVSTQTVSRSRPLMPAQSSASCAAPINSNSRRMWQRTPETSSFCPKMLSHNRITVAISPCHPSPQHSKCKEVAIAEASLVTSTLKMEHRLRVKFSKIETSVSLLSTKSNSLLNSIKVATINRYLTEASTLNKR